MTAVSKERWGGGKTIAVRMIRTGGETTTNTEARQLHRRLLLHARNRGPDFVRRPAHGVSIARRSLVMLRPVYMYCNSHCHPVFSFTPSVRSDGFWVYTKFLWSKGGLDEQVVSGDGSFLFVCARALGYY